MRRIVFVVPGPISTLTGGSVYDRRMAEGLSRRGWAVEIRELDGDFPYPTPDTLGRAADAFAAIPSGTLALVDGLVLGATPSIIEHAASRLTIAAMVHLPLAADVNAQSDVAGLEAGEGRALAAAARVIVTGKATIPLLGRYDLEKDKVVVVEPGTDRAPRAHGGGGPPIQILSVGTLQPGKGYEVLLQALAATDCDGWHLTCAGSLTRCPAAVDRVFTTMRSLGLEDRVSIVGELDPARLADCYDGSDLFALATLQETYGMAVAEALARGLPVISTATGAIPDLVGRDAGLVVPPGDTRALSEALSTVLRDGALRACLAAGAARARERLPDWEHASDTMASVLDGIDRHG